MAEISVRSQLVCNNFIHHGQLNVPIDYQLGSPRWSIEADLGSGGHPPCCPGSMAIQLSTGLSRSSARPSCVSDES